MAVSTKIGENTFFVGKMFARAVEFLSNEESVCLCEREREKKKKSSQGRDRKILGFPGRPF